MKSGSINSTKKNYSSSLKLNKLLIINNESKTTIKMGKNCLMINLIARSIKSMDLNVV